MPAVKRKQLFQKHENPDIKASNENKDENNKLEIKASNENKDENKQLEIITEDKENEEIKQITEQNKVGKKDIGTEMNNDSPSFCSYRSVAEIPSYIYKRSLKNVRDTASQWQDPNLVSSSMSFPKFSSNLHFDRRSFMNIFRPALHLLRAKAVKNVFILFLMLCFPSWMVYHKVNSFFYELHKYSIVIDAGSTGSRVFTFHFKFDPQGVDKTKPSVRLVEEKFKSIEPGISFYIDDPSQAAKSLVPLVNHALTFVPRDYRPYSLLTLRATAGLRLMSPTKRDQMMEEIQTLLMLSPFHVPNASLINVMSGTEEGLLGWISVNYILDVLWNKDRKSTAVAFDLGGASTQVAFEVSIEKRMLHKCVQMNGDIYMMKLMEREFIVYTHSYLGFGLKAARAGIMGASISTPSFSRMWVEAENVLQSSCHVNYDKFRWLYNNVNYTVTGTENEGSKFKSCLKVAKEYVRNARIVTSPELVNRDLHLFSYYFDVAKWGDLVPHSQHHTIITPQDYFTAAEEYCEERNSKKGKPFLCMDLLYVYSLLTEGFHLPPLKKLHVETRLLGREVSWSLGAALSNLSGEFSYTSLCAEL